jgi:hypothetical protein
MSAKHSCDFNEERLPRSVALDEVESVLPCQRVSFRQILDRLPSGIDRQLGYSAAAAWVLFYFDQRAEDIIWDDGHTYGIGTGGWRVFEELIEPIAQTHHAELGSNAHAIMAFVLNRETNSAYFVELSEARRVVRDQHGRERLGIATGKLNQLPD